VIAALNFRVPYAIELVSNPTEWRHLGRPRPRWDNLRMDLK